MSKGCEYTMCGLLVVISVSLFIISLQMIEMTALLMR